MNVLYSKLFSCKVGKKVPFSSINVPMDYLEQVMLCFPTWEVPAPNLA